MITVIRQRSFVWTAAASMCAVAAVAAAQPSPTALQDCARITQDSERLACFDRAMTAPAGSASGAAAAAPATAASPQGASAAATYTAPAAAASPPAAAAAASPPAAPAPATPSAAAATAGSAAAAAAVAAAGAGAGNTIAAAPGAGAETLTPEQKFGLSGEGIRKLEAREGVKGAEAKPVKELDAHVAGVSHNSAGRAVLTLDNGQVWRQCETRPSFAAHAGDAVRITPGALGSYWLSTSTHNWTRVERLP